MVRFRNDRTEPQGKGTVLAQLTYYRGDTVLRLHDFIGDGEIQRIEAIVDRLRAAGARRVRLDCSAVSHVDYRAVPALAKLIEHSGALGCPVHTERCCEHVRRILRFVEPFAFEAPGSARDDHSRAPALAAAR